MKVYLINLDKNTDRLAYVDEQLKRLGIEYERVSAVYGKELTAAERRVKFNVFRSFLCEGRRVTPGEIGCALSHLGIYADMKEDMVCVLEDDIAIGDDFPQVLKEIENFCNPNRPQVVLLSAHGIRPENRKASGVERLRGGTCADGYVITRTGAQVIYHSNFPVVAVADRWIRWMRRFNLELYRAWPMTVRQDGERFPETDVSSRPTRPRGIKMILRKGVRTLEMIIDWAFFKLTGK